MIRLACLGTAAWALIDCVTRPTQAFVAAGKLTKPVWLAITAGALLLLWAFGPFGLLGLGLASIVAAIVYLVDVRPALREAQGGGRW